MLLLNWSTSLVVLGEYSNTTQFCIFVVGVLWASALFILKSIYFGDKKCHINIQKEIK